MRAHANPKFTIVASFSGYIALLWMVGERATHRMNLRLERRISPRRNTSTPAEIVFSGGRAVRPCIVRNTSETGAKLEVSAVRDIPNTFDLRIPGHRAQSCRVVWRALKEIGVAFVGAE